jgi:hypothetical protein
MPLVFLEACRLSASQRQSVAESDDGRKTSARDLTKDMPPLFTDLDVAHMKPVGIDLSSREDVSAHADAIHRTLRVSRPVFVEAVAGASAATGSRRRGLGRVVSAAAGQH